MIVNLVDRSKVHIQKCILELGSLSKGPMTVESNSNITLNAGIKFKTPYSFCKVEQGTTFKMRYLGERWTFFNRELFGGAMKEPNFKVTKAVKDPRILGFWQVNGSVLSMSHKMFILPDDKQLLGVLVHESAHQYDSDVLKTPFKERMVNKGHGPSWEGIMRAVGMPADHKYAGDYLELLDQKQKDNLELRDAPEERAPNKITKDSFGGEPFVYALYLTRMGKAEPAILLDSPSYDPSTNIYRYFNKKFLNSGNIGFASLSYFIKPTTTQLKKFPPEFFTVSTLHKVNELYKYYRAKDDLKR